MSLLDTNTTQYVIKWEGYGYPIKDTAKIENEKGEKIGSIIFKGKKKEAQQTDLLDAEDSLVLTVVHTFSGLDKCEIKDSNGNMIAFVEIGKIPWWGKHEEVMENLEKKEILTTYASFGEGDHQIKSPSKKVLAEFETTMEKIKKSFWHADYYNVSFFQINDLNFDKKFLWASFMSHLTLYHQASS